MTEVAWWPISPDAKASATRGIASRCLPTQSRSEAALGVRPQVWAAQEQGVCRVSRLAPRFRARLRVVQRVPWRPSTRLESSLGSTKSRSALAWKSRTAALSLSNSPDMLESYQTNVRIASVNSHHFYSNRFQAPPPRPLHRFPLDILVRI